MCSIMTYRVAFTKIRSRLRHEGDPQNLKETMRSERSKLTVRYVSIAIVIHMQRKCMNFVHACICIRGRVNGSHLV